MRYDIINPGRPDINSLVAAGKEDFILFLDEKAVLAPDALDRLTEYIKAADSDFVAFELRRSPVESGRHYNPVTLETTGFDGVAVAVNRRAFVRAGGFDRKLDVMKFRDLAKRLMAEGRIMYCPKAVVTVDPAEKADDKYIYTHTEYEKLLLTFKYGNLQQIKERKSRFINTIKNPRHFEGVRKDLLKLYLQHYKASAAFMKMRKSAPEQYRKIIPDFSFGPDRGSENIGENTDYTPLVSVVVRTHKRPGSLRETLKSLENQLYDNFEIVVVEDGENTAEAMLKAEFSHLNLRYFYTGVNVGRGKAGNTGIEKAEGELICFLDDDDYYYADCISTFVSKLAENPQADMVIAGGMAFKCRVLNDDPYRYRAEETYPIRFDHITLMDMCVRCRIPMPCGMFRKELYNRYGGMREDIGGDEDWAMWLKFMAGARRINPNGPDIHKSLSLFGYPADRQAARKREEAYRLFDRRMLYDENLVFNVTGREIRSWENYVRADMRHLENMGALADFIKNLKPLGEEKLEYHPEGSYNLTAKQINNYYYWLVKQYSAGK